MRSLANLPTYSEVHYAAGIRTSISDRAAGGNASAARRSGCPATAGAVHLRRGGSADGVELAHAEALDRPQVGGPSRALARRSQSTTPVHAVSNDWVGTPRRC